MKRGVYAGSFCPVTNGHVDAIEKAARLVDKLYVVVGVNPSKRYAMSDEARFSAVSKAVAHLPEVEVVFYGGMMTDFCKSVNADVMIKSIRNATDLQQVIDLADVNADFWQGETVFVVGDKNGATFPPRWCASLLFWARTFPHTYPPVAPTKFAARWGAGLRKKKARRNQKPQPFAFFVTKNASAVGNKQFSPFLRQNAFAANQTHKGKNV